MIVFLRGKNKEHSVVDLWGEGLKYVNTGVLSQNLGVLQKGFHFHCNEMTDLGDFNHQL